MKILAFMQNMWLKDPERHKRTLQRYIGRGYPDRAEALRRRMIHYALFAGCKSGRILKKYLGEYHCSNIVWEEASREVGGASSSCFKADLDHMKARILQERPDLILTFGNIARDAANKIDLMLCFLAAPHPASRDLGLLDRKLKSMRCELDNRLRSECQKSTNQPKKE